jgi:4-amino-4-deoxy-L-arabinose transferase-like glycosyltransferase
VIAASRVRLRAPAAWVWLVAIFVVAVSLRFGWLAVNSHSVRFAGLAAANGDEARNIVTHDRWFVVNDAAPRPPTGRLEDPASVDYRAADAHPRYREAVLEPPAVPLLLAGIWSVTGDQRFIYLQALQLLIDSSMVFLVYWLALKLCDRRSAALLAAALYAIYLPLVLVARIPHGDAWAGYFTMSALALTLKAREADKPGAWLLGLGTLIGVGSYFRPNLLLLPIALALALVPWSGLRRAVRLAVVPLLVSGLFLAPWTLHNYKVFHTLVPVRTSLGWTMWVGLGELPNHFGATGTDANAVETVRRIHPDYAVGSPKFDSVLVRKSLSAIAAHPLFYAKLVGRRLLHATVLPTSTTTASGSGLFRLLSLLQPALFLFAAATGVFLFRRLRWWRGNLALLGAVAAATVLPYVAIHLEARFILATSFVYIILAGAGISAVTQRAVVATLSKIANSSAVRMRLRKGAASKSGISTGL